MISVIVTSKNSEKTIEKTLISIISQKEVEFEIIVLDCNSQDATKSIVNKYIDYVSLFRIEEDNGLYFAWNDGIKLAKGEYIFFLNSDDEFYNDFSLASLLTPFHNNQNIELSHGRIYSFEPESNYYQIKGGKADLFSFLFGMSQFLTPTALFKRDNLIHLGGFNTKYKVSSDFDLAIRYFKIFKESNIKFVDNIITKFQVGGLSTKNQNLAYDEIKIIVDLNYNFIEKFIYNFWNFVRKIKFFFFSNLRNTRFISIYRKIKSKSFK